MFSADGAHAVCLVSKKVDLGKLGQQNQPHAGGAMLGLLTTVVSSSSGGVCGRGALVHRPWVSAVLGLLWFGVCVVVFRALLGPVAALVAKRTELLELPTRVIQSAALQAAGFAGNMPALEWAISIRIGEIGRGYSERSVGVSTNAVSGWSRPHRNRPSRSA